MAIVTPCSTWAWPRRPRGSARPRSAPTRWASGWTPRAGAPRASSRSTTTGGGGGGGAGRGRGFPPPGRQEAVFLADPAATDALADELLPWLRGQRPVVELMTFAGDPARLAAFERHGLRHRRSSFTLARPGSSGPVPAPAFPEGVDVARYRLGQGDEDVHRLVYVDSAWASVPGHAERDRDGCRLMELPCRSAFLARRDG